VKIYAKLIGDNEKSRIKNLDDNKNLTGEFALKGNGRKGGWIYKDPLTGRFVRTRGKTPNRALYRAFRRRRAAISARAEQVMKGL